MSCDRSLRAYIWSTHVGVGAHPEGPNPEETPTRESQSNDGVQSHLAAINQAAGRPAGDGAQDGSRRGQ